MSNTNFCIDLNEKFTRIGHAKENRHILDITSAGQIETVPSYYETMSERVAHEQAQKIKELKKKLKIRKKEVNVVIPDVFAFSQIIEMPKLKEKELVAAIKYQADEFIPMPINETYIDLEVLDDKSDKSKQLVLIIASPMKIIDYVYKTMEYANLTPQALENELSTIGRIFAELLRQKDGASIIFNMGYTGSSLYIKDEQRNLIIFMRKIKIGLQLFSKYLKVNLNWPDDKVYEALLKVGITKTETLDLATILSPLLKELVDEIQKVISVARDTYKLQIKQIYVYNLNDQIAHLNTHIKEQTQLQTLSVPVSKILKPNEITKALSADISSYVSVIGGNYR